MKAVAIITIVVAAAAATASADETVARDAFRRAQELTAENPPRWAEACPLFEASYRADPQIGVLLYLADCHEKIGRTASAWAEFNDAVELARQRGDKRESIARSRADALAPSLAKLHIVPPPKLIAGLVVRRDGVDISALVGSDMAIDPGEHQIAASAPGYSEWSQKVAITTGVSRLEIPALEKAPEKPAVPKGEGTLTVRSQADAEITIDQSKFGTGTATGKVRAGGHTLRVTAPHMRPYQQEIQISPDEPRTIDVPLEPELAVVGAREETPTFELGASVMSGVKLRNEKPIVLALRAELALRLGTRVNFGVFAEAGEIDTSKGCGFDIPGPDPTTPFDVGPRTQMTKCTYIMPGLQLYVHLKPHQRFDPYVGIAPGFRFGFVRYTPFLDGQMAPPRSDVFPAIVTGLRVGVSYRPKPGPTAWEIGGYVEGAFTIIGKDGDNAFSEKDDAEATFMTIFAGVRSTYMF